jgi:hypothetical protein
MDFAAPFDPAQSVVTGRLLTFRQAIGGLPMQTLGNAREHFWRVIKMADANRVDLSDALDTGRITVEDYSEMITKCRGCTEVGKCDRLLSALPSLEKAPAYCENRDTFAELKTG